MREARYYLFMGQGIVCLGIIVTQVGEAKRILPHPVADCAMDAHATHLRRIHIPSVIFSLDFLQGLMVE
jgi:hypothetical protein